MCSKGCCEVGTYIYGKNSTFFDDDDYDNDNNKDDNNTISHYEAFHALYIGGHPNYNLPAYCVEIGHIECLKKISKEEDFMYHSDLAIVAIEHDNLECLQYIVEHLGDVKLVNDINDVGENCKEYVKNILCNRIRKNRQPYVIHKKGKPFVKKITP